MTSSSRSVLFVCDFNAHGGTQTHLLHLIRGLDRRRFVPSLATLTLQEGLARRLEHLDVEVVDLGLEGALRLSTARALAKLAARARKRADLLHGFLYQGNLMTAALSLLSGVPCITSVRNLDIGKRRRQRLASGLAHRMAERVVFNSAVVRDATVRAERIPCGRAVVIYNGVEDPGPGPSPAGRDGRRTVVCVASLREKKGHAHLIDAWRIVRARLPEARLLLAGEGPARGDLERRVIDADLADAIGFAGYRSDVQALLRDADVFVLSSLEEGMPNALLEAMAAGLPCVVTRVGGTAEAVDEGVTGFLVPPADPAALADRILALLADPDLRRRAGEAARRKFAAAFSLEAMIRSYHDLYDSALRGRLPS